MTKIYDKKTKKQKKKTAKEDEKSGSFRRDLQFQCYKLEAAAFVQHGLTLLARLTKVYSKCLSKNLIAFRLFHSCVRVVSGSSPCLAALSDILAPK